MHLSNAYRKLNVSSRRELPAPLRFGPETDAAETPDLSAEAEPAQP
ncbi:MAG: hypothetical protein M3131_00215 [Actinomycetota bacterium]|nr:hypothetical protein [Actinomycetota bacterium]